MTHGYDRGRPRGRRGPVPRPPRRPDAEASAKHVTREAAHEPQRAVRLEAGVGGRRCRRGTSIARGAHLARLLLRADFRRSAHGLGQRGGRHGPVVDGPRAQLWRAVSGRPLSDSTGRTMILDVSELEEPMGAFSWPRAPVRGRALTRSWRRSGRGVGRYPAYTMRGPYRDRPRGREASSRDRASRQNVRWNGESMEKTSDVESPTSSPARPDRCTPRTTRGARGPPP